MNKLIFGGVLCLGLMLSNRYANAQFERDAPEEKQKERDTGESAWEKYLQKLGKGPVYRVEVLHRDDETGMLCYFRMLISKNAPQPTTIGFGLDRDGKCVPPPDTGHSRLIQVTQEALKVGEVRKAPLAFETHVLNIHFDKKQEEPKSLDIGVSCLGTSIALPEKPGQVISKFHSGLFRVEHLSADEVAKEPPLRLDPKLYKYRIAAMLKETLAAHRAEKSKRDLTTAAITFQDPIFVDAVRKELNEWIDREPEDVKGKGFPNDLAYAIAKSGEAKDFDSFHRLAKRHAWYASYVNYPTLMLIKRVGGVKAVALVRDILKDDSPSESEQANEKLVRQLDDTVPKPTQADGFLVTMVGMFKLNPADFGLRMAETRLLELTDKHKFTAKELELLRTLDENKSGTWMMMKEADRKPGYEAALKWIAERK